MSKEDLLHKVLKTLAQSPESRIQEVNDFADYILKRHEEEVIQQGIEKLTTDSKSFEFLKEEEDLYTVEDLKEKSFNQLNL